MKLAIFAGALVESKEFGPDCLFILTHNVDSEEL